MRELMERNGLEPADFVSVILTCTDDLNAQFPAVGARAVGLDQVPLLCNRELDVPGRDGAGDPGARPLLRARRPPARARLPRRDAEAARRPALGAVSRWRSSSRDKLAAIPGYVAGAPAGKAPESIADEGIAQLASNESPFGPHPAVAEAIAARRRRRQPLPGPERGPAAAPDRRALRGRPGRGRARQRLLRDPARRGAGAVRARRRARLRAGPRSRSTRTWRRSRARARSGCRWPRATSTTSTRSPTEITAATQLVVVCNPNNPTATHLPAARIADFCERMPDHVTVLARRGLRRVPARRRPRRQRSTCAATSRTWSCLRTFSKVYGLAGLRVGYALVLAEVPRRGRRRAPAVQRQRDRPGRRRRGDPPSGRRRRPRRAQPDRAGRRSRRACASSGSRRPTRRRTSPGSTSATRRGGGRRGARRAGDPRPPRHAARRPGPHPGHLRDPGREPALPRCARPPCSELRSAPVD